ncbi:MAG: CRTAC1 family protein [Chloroflexi bacterium]|nr:CRTAC1 family protein [Chloroflexota bacterium]
MRVSLLRNNGDGTFEDVTYQAGIARPAYPSQSAAWADYDNDGDLDVFLCNESVPESWLNEAVDESLSAKDVLRVFPSQLFRNNGNGTFTDVAVQAGVTNLRYCKGSGWGDYDNDGDADLYLSNFGEGNRLYRNNADGTFTDVARELGVEEPTDSFATWFWDYNNDGWLDLFVAGYGYDIADVAADYLELPNNGTRPRLYRNNGAGGFVDVTRESGLYRVHMSMGANFGDLDNDGFLDFYLGTGYPAYDAIGPNIMYRNDAGRRFQDVTFSGGFGHLQKGHGVAFGDIDRDGDQDVFIQIGGFFPGDGFANALYQNPGHGNRWISVKLEGVRSNRAAIGARIRVEVESEEGARIVYVHVSSGGSFGASSLEQEIGLGQARRIKSLEVYWPTSGLQQTFDEVPLDSHIQVREGDSELTILDRRRTEISANR